MESGTLTKSVKITLNIFAVQFTQQSPVLEINTLIGKDEQNHQVGY